MRLVQIVFFIISSLTLYAQYEIQWIDQLDLDKIESNSINKYWLKIMDNGMSQPIGIPIIVLKGNQQSPVLGLSAAIHGNELNGIKIIHELVNKIDVSKLEGTIIAIPGLNNISVLQHQRRFIDDTDLNRIFPGKINGNRSQQYVYHIKTKVLSQIEYLIDMHTASFGRENSLYVRGKLDDNIIGQLAMIQDADIILNSNGLPSTGSNNSTRTMRAEAMLSGIPCITVEYGNPQVFQPEMVSKGLNGIMNALRFLNMIEGEIKKYSKPVICEKSYWIYVEEGGYLDIKVKLKQLLKKGDLIAIMRNPFGDVLHQYFCPEDGIVIGKSSNPINMTGGRIIHLGIIDKS